MEEYGNEYKSTDRIKMVKFGVKKTKKTIKKFKS